MNTETKINNPNTKIKETVKGRKPELLTYLEKFTTKYGTRIPRVDLDKAIAALEALKPNALVAPVVPVAPVAPPAPVVSVAPVSVAPTQVENVTVPAATISGNEVAVDVAELVES